MRNSKTSFIGPRETCDCALGVPSDDLPAIFAGDPTTVCGFLPDGAPSIATLYKDFGNKLQFIT